MKKMLFLFSVAVLTLIAALFMLKCTADSSKDTGNIFDEVTKHEGVFVRTIERQQLDKRLLLHVSYPITENESINKAVAEMSQDFIARYEKRVSEVRERRAPAKPDLPAPLRLGRNISK